MQLQAPRKIPQAKKWDRVKKINLPTFDLWELWGNCARKRYRH